VSKRNSTLHCRSGKSSAKHDTTLRALPSTWRGMPPFPSRGTVSCRQAFNDYLIVGKIFTSSLIQQGCCHGVPEICQYLFPVRHSPLTEVCIYILTVMYPPVFFWEKVKEGAV